MRASHGSLSALTANLTERSIPTVGAAAVCQHFARTGFTYVCLFTQEQRKFFQVCYGSPIGSGAGGKVYYGHYAGDDPHIPETLAAKVK
jgi:hypothetical protein